MPRDIIFGEIPGIEEGHWFEGRKEMMPSSFHRNWGAGIDGNGSEGTAAIVLSGGYEDDKDLGDEIIYTGAGGNDPNTGKQIADQTWENRGNAGLVKSMNEGLPVRVIRGHQHNSPYSPKTGYSYAGLYSVLDAWQETGKNIEVPSSHSSSLNVLGFINRSCHFESFIFEGSVNTDVVVACFNEFAKIIKKPTYVLVDNASTHTSNFFLAQLDAWKELGLLVIHLSTYSPELNIIEILWRKIKYEWIPFSAYESFSSLEKELFNILSKVGKEYFIAYT